MIRNTMPSLALVLGALTLVNRTGAHAYSYTNCTLPPDETHNFVSAPNIRGTMEIFWSCITTVVACTYTVLHLNVPEQRDGKDRDRGWKGDLKWWWIGLWPSIKWTLICVFAPEFYTAIAAQEFVLAKATLRQLEALPKERHPPFGFSKVHAWFANMGGFAARRGTLPGLTSGETGIPTEHFVAALDGYQVLRLLQCEAASTVDASLSLPLPTEADISDRSKTDAFAKGLAALQIFYFCANCVIRATKHLPVTLFELGTVGFALCSLASYGLLFHKPRSVKTPITLVHLKDDTFPTGKTILSLTRFNPTDRVANGVWDRLRPQFAVATLGGSLLLGAIHISGWNCAFPSSVDRWLWRSCSIASATVGLAFLLLFGFTYCLLDGRFYQSMFHGCLVAYFLFRMVLIVEMIRCLFYLPHEAFVTTWATYVPHIG